MPQFAATTSIQLGQFKVTFLADGGGVVEPVALYPASSPEGWQAHADLLNEEGKFITSIGAFLIETGERVIAVDLGIGPVYLDFPGFGPFSGGKYLESLAQTGLAPEAVTDVFFTHMHLDHVGWTTREVNGERQLTYPNARYLASAAEWNCWRGGDSPLGPHPEFVQKPLENRLEMVAGGDMLAPGISIVSTPGHTPGHLSLLLQAGSERLYLLGDVMHGVMQLEEKSWTVAFDSDPAQARQTREQLYEELVKPNTLVAAGHFSDAVFGRIVQAGDRLRWAAM